MANFETWYKNNNVILEHLYYKLLNICDKHNFIISDTDKCYNKFLKMMYNQSNKIIIKKELFPEFYENYIKE